MRSSLSFSGRAVCNGNLNMAILDKFESARIKQKTKHK
jgi:hypothetical protein